MVTTAPPIPPDRVLWGRGRPRSFTGRHLREIAFPLGGIGTGTVSLGGRGDLRDWEIFNRPAKGLTLPQSFVALWARERGRNPVTRVVAARPQSPLTAARGLPRAGVPGLPHLRRARFTGAYPLARIDFEDEALPLTVALEAFNPFVPLAPEDSGLPVAILRCHLTNPGRRAVEATLALSALNPIGFLPPAPLEDRRAPCFGGNVNALVRGAGFTAISMTSERVAPDDLAHGSLALATPHPDVTWRLAWGGEAWFDDLQIFWDEFSRRGRLAEQRRVSPTPEGVTEHASLGARVTLAPGESRTIPLLLAWHFPNRDNHWNTEVCVRGARMRNAYADRFTDALAVAQHTAADLERLESKTRRFRDALFASTLPRHVLDAVASNLVPLRSNTVLWLDDGRLHGFEGCDEATGCCPMDCTHVWNYSHSEAALFPSLARSMRETDFTDSTDATGHMAFRSLVPLGRGRWAWQGACDGQFGTLVRLFREWTLSGDEDFLRRHWPRAKRALDHALATWDPDGDGLPEAAQHVTYDVEFVGPNPLTGALCLAALRAMTTMAETVGDEETAARCRDLFARGRARMEELCWNGAFYEQRLDLAGAPKYQVGPGCLADQLMGEWMARSVGTAASGVPMKRTRSGEAGSALT